MGRTRIAVFIPVMLVACGQIAGLDGDGGAGGTGTQAPLPDAAASGETRPVQRPDAATRPAAPAPAPAPAAAASAASLDTVSDAEKDAARAAAQSSGGGGALGEVTVALGDPADPGLWVKTNLVSADTPGTVRTGSGDAIAVTLRPIGSGDGGAQISLAALRALGLPLTGLHPVTLARAG